MSDRVDAYIVLHFEDLSAPDTGKEDFVLTLEEAETASLEVAGVEVQESVPVPGENKAVIALSATPSGQRKLFEDGDVRRLEATDRAARIPVWLHLKTPDWNRKIAGLERGHRLGPILSAIATEPAIRELAKDPDIISIEASRVGGAAECVRSMPWIG